MRRVSYFQPAFGKRLCFPECKRVSRTSSGRILSQRKLQPNVAGKRRLRNHAD